MSRRSDFPRCPRGFYPTPVEAVVPLLPYLPQGRFAYVEPCAGDGALVRALAELWPQGTCAMASDLVPGRAWIEEADAGTLQLPPCDVVITNPPFPMPGARGGPTLGLIRSLAAQRPTWLLLPWAFGANAYFAAVAPWCVRAVPIGRVSWMGNGVRGKEDCGRWMFDARHTGAAQLMARAA